MAVNSSGNPAKIMLTIPRSIRYAPRNPPSRPMQIIEEKDGDLLIVSLRGHLDTIGAPAFEERVMNRIGSGVRCVVLDCSGLEYVNSAGLKSFLVVARRAELDGKFAVCALSQQITALFATIGFDQIMTVVPTRQDAIRLYQGESPAGVGAKI
jgi:anti-anti-sigma factor